MFTVVERQGDNSLTKVKVMQKEGSIYATVYADLELTTRPT